MTSTTDLSLTKGKWVNPCGLLGDAEQPDTDGRNIESLMQSPTDVELLSEIDLQVKIAYMHAENLRENLIKTTFGNFSDLQKDYKSHRYDWLPSKEEIPKNLSEKLAPEYLEKLEINTALVDAYEIMQKFAVALEEVVWDQKRLVPELRNEMFGETELKLRLVLCEIQIVLAERQIRPRPDVSRSIMPAEHRNLASGDATYRNIRDWLILRDYMNGLEYIKQVFDHLRKDIKT